MSKCRMKDGEYIKERMSSCRIKDDDYEGENEYK